MLREWLSSHDEFHNMFEEALHAPLSDTSNKLISVLNNLIDFARKFLKISEYMSPLGKGWEEYRFNDLLIIVDRFKKLQKDLRLILDARKEAYEHALKCHELILTAVWGTEKWPIECSSLLCDSRYQWTSLSPGSFPLRI